MAGGSAIGGVEWHKRAGAIGKQRKSSSQHSRMDEIPGDPMGSQPCTPSVYEKGVVKNISKTLPQYLSASGRTPLQDLDGIITPNGLFLRAPSRRRADHRSRATSADAAWAGGSPAGIHDGRYQAVSVRIADLFHRVLGQSRLHKNLWKDRLRSGQPGQLRRVDRRAAERAR